MCCLCLYTYYNIIQYEKPTNNILLAPQCYLENSKTFIKSGNRELQEHYILTVNEYYNKNWASVSKHPKLQWLSLVACSYGKGETYFHEWIPLKKEKNKKEEFLAELFPNMKRADVETLAAITTDSEIKEYCQGLGWDKKQINAIKL